MASVIFTNIANIYFNIVKRGEILCSVCIEDDVADTC